MSFLHCPSPLHTQSLLSYNRIDLTERLVDETDQRTTPGENPTYVPSAVGFHVRPGPSTSLVSDSTLFEVTNPLLEEEGDGGEEEQGGDSMDRDGNASLTVSLQNPLYTTGTERNGVGTQTGDIPPRTNGSAAGISNYYSTYALVGDRHAEVLYDTIDHKFRPAIQVASDSPSSSVASSMAGSVKYAYVRMPGAVRVQAVVHDSQGVREPGVYSTPYQDMQEHEDT